MIPYFLVAGAASVLGYVTSLRGLRLLWWVLPLGLLVVMSGGRFGIGTDFFLYQGFFDRVGSMSFSDALQVIPQEYGFVLVTWLVRRITEDSHAYFMIVALLTIVPVMIAIRKASPAPALSVFLYVALGFYPRSFNTVRQSLAVSLVFLAEVYRYDRKWLWLVLSCIAPFIHVSALIVVLGMFPLSRLRITPARFLSLLVVSLVVGITVFRLDVLQNFLTGLNSRYEGYVDSSSGGGIGTVLRLIVVSALVMLCIAYGQRRGTGEARVGHRELRYTTYFSLSPILLAFGLANVQIVRIEEYVGIFGILAIPWALQGSRQRSALVVIVSVVAFVYLGAYVTNYGGVVPYVFRGQ